ncbi:hypothetical protein LCGC14_1596820, partial [marine sediment metagenome]
LEYTSRTIPARMTLDGDPKANTVRLSVYNRFSDLLTELEDNERLVGYEAYIEGKREDIFNIWISTVANAKDLGIGVPVGVKVGFDDESHSRGNTYFQYGYENKTLNLTINGIQIAAYGNDSIVYVPNVTSSNLFVPVDLFTHTNATTTLPGASTWANVSFAIDFVGEPDDDVKFGILHDRTGDQNHTFTILFDGIYSISYNFDVEDTSLGNSDIDVAGRAIYDNGTEIHGSVFETDIIRVDVETELFHPFSARLEAGDVVVFQFVADNGNVRISTHGTFGDQPESASVQFIKIRNIPI